MTGPEAAVRIAGMLVGASFAMVLFLYLLGVFDKE
jgi:hypothetical protein